MTFVKISARINDLLNISHPLICAPMANVTGGLLATRVTEAGGLGLIGSGYCDTQWLEKQLNVAKPGMFGVGFITWRLAENPDILDLALKNKPRAVWLSFGEIEPFTEKIKKANVPLICQVQNVKQAKECKAKGADIIVAQGTEAGGHGATRSTMALVPSVVDAVTPLPVMAAGGISDARGFSAAFMLGAEGVVMGTRFLACEESLASDYAKTAVVNSSGDNTIRTSIFDYGRRYNFPKPYTARSLQNQFTNRWTRKNKLSEEEKEHLKKEYQHSVMEGNDKNIAVFAGKGIDLIHNILPAKIFIEQLVCDLHKIKVDFS